MSWVKIDDGAPEHPKLLSVGAAAAWLWVCGLAYCNRQKRRDGFIPFAKVKLLYPGLGIKHADALVRAGLWEPAPMGFNVHDYHDYQPSEPTEELSVLRCKAGRLGGINSGAARRTKAEATTKQVASEDGSNTPEAPTRPDPVPIPSPLDPPVSPPVGDTSKPRRKREGWTVFPADYAVTDEDREIAAQHGKDVDLERTRIGDHEFVRPRKDPGKTFRNWLRSPYNAAPKLNGHPAESRADQQTKLLLERREMLRRQEQQEGNP